MALESGIAASQTMGEPPRDPHVLIGRPGRVVSDEGAHVHAGLHHPGN